MNNFYLGCDVSKGYAVLLLPILKWLKNQSMKKYFLLYQQLDYKIFVFIENKLLFQ
jgi:hypothetical protein